MTAKKVIIVVPCFNEATRLSIDAFESFGKTHPTVQFVFVNDGSTDSTLDIISGLHERDRFRYLVIDLQPNRGKAEAVRAGMLRAFEERPDYAGYWDADLATPLEEIPYFIEVLEKRPDCQTVFGSRVKLLGRSIERNPLRHYLGRAFATVVSATLRLPIYDTQCGAKLFRVSTDIELIFDEPFSVGWIFDVEIIARLIQAKRDVEPVQPERFIYEYPLHQWHDVAGSKVRFSDFFRAVVEIERIHRRYLR